MSVTMKEMDLSTAVPNSTAVSGLVSTPRGPKFPVPKIRRFSKHYFTNADYKSESIPRSLLFSTKRAAKRFFGRPILITSTRMMCVIFGEPDSAFSKRVMDEIKTQYVPYVVRANV